MKVLHVLNHSVPHTDGYCVRSAQIVAGQAAIGMEPVVVTSPHQEPEPTEAVELIDGIKYYRVVPSRKKRFPYFHELYAIRRLASRINEVVQEERPDILHAHSPCLWGEAAGRVARRRKIPFVYEVRGLWQGESDYERIPLKYRIARLLETRVARRADGVVAISSPLRDDLVSRGIAPDRVFVVPNGVDLERFAPRPHDAQLGASLGLNGGVCLGYLGSLYPFEGVDDLVVAMKAIAAQAPNAKLVIVGGGNQATAIRRRVAELRLEDCVRLVGGVPHDEVAKYYSIMDVMVYPRKRGRTTDLVTPLKPLEAMALGKPILASDVGGLRALLGRDAALYFRSEDRRDLADKCLHLINSADYRRALASRAREHVVRSHEWSRLIGGYRQVYRFASDAKRFSSAGPQD